MTTKGRTYPKVDGHCPCCGQVLQTTFSAVWNAETRQFVCATGSVQFTRSQAIVFDRVWKDRFVQSLETFVDDMWALDPNGGPDGAINVISAHLSRMRRGLELLGWTISGRRDGYRLKVYDGVPLKKKEA